MNLKFGRRTSLLFIYLLGAGGAEQLGIFFCELEMEDRKNGGTSSTKIIIVQTLRTMN